MLDPDLTPHQNMNEAYQLGAYYERRRLLDMSYRIPEDTIGAYQRDAGATFGGAARLGVRLPASGKKGIAVPTTGRDDG